MSPTRPHKYQENYTSRGPNFDLDAEMSKLFIGSVNLQLCFFPHLTSEDVTNTAFGDAVALRGIRPTTPCVQGLKSMAPLRKLSVYSRIFLSLFLFLFLVVELIIEFLLTRCRLLSRTVTPTAVVDSVSSALQATRRQTPQ